MTLAPVRTPAAGGGGPGLGAVPSTGRRVGPLDGLRAVAVIGVLAYHAGIGWFGGGLLGVDVFFVVSGFLITTLLVGERFRTGRISLVAFWRRRAKRLLPALLLMLGGLALYSRWSMTVAPGQLRGDFLSSLFYVANWHYILADQGYFARFGAPSPLLHTWSLSVEEQFYLIWPLAVGLCLRRWTPRLLGVVCAVGAAASALEMAVLYDAGASISRLYYGTDTRAQALMVGSLLAVVLSGAGTTRAEGPVGARTGVRARLVAGPGLAGAAFIAFALHRVSGTAAFLYQGGFLLVAVAVAAVVYDVVRRPSGMLARLLGVAPLRYIGRISYGLYLYHWPLFLALDSAHTGLSGPGLLGLRLAVTLTVAVASFHLVEEPVRTGRLLRGWKAVTAGTAGATAVTAALLAVTATAASATPVSPSALAGALARLAPAPPGTYPPDRPLVRAMVVGDSMGVTLAEGLQIDSSGWGVQVENDATLGCDMNPDTTVSITGVVGPASQSCAGWPAHYAELVQRDDPDVVAVLLGRFETADRLWDGRWVSVGDPAFDAHLRSQLVQAIDILSSRGARVALLTLPYVIQTTDAPNGSAWDVNLPSRTDKWNELVRQAAAERPGVASVVNLNAMLDPGGRYTSYIDGIRVRDTDQEHISLAGGEYLRAEVLPVLAHLGQARAELRTHG